MNLWNGEITGRIRRQIVNGVPCNAYYPRPRNINAMLEETTARYPDHVAFVEDGQRTTYREFSLYVSSLAWAMRHQAGIGRGDRVAVICQNTHIFCISVFAILQLGATVVPVSSKFKPAEVQTILAGARPSLIITENESWRREFENYAHPVWLIQHLSELPQPLADHAAFPPTEAREDDVAFLMHTSGTTGNPKGAMLTHANVVHGALNYQLCYGVDHSDTTVIAVPIFHGTGLMAQLMPLVGAGGTSVLLPRFSAKKTLELFEQEKATYFIAPPTVYSLLLQEKDDAADYSTLKKLVVGGAPLAPVLYQNMRTWLPQAFFINTYGLTEATSPALMTPLDKAEERHGESVGIASPCMEAKLVDPVTQADMPPGSTGELWLKGALVCKGYWENPDATAKSFDEGWLRTGDIAYQDEEGFFFIRDRMKDMINRGGEKVYSIEVEDVIQSHPEVVEVAVLPAPDAVYGEVVRAVVVVRPGSDTTPDDIMQWVRDRLAKYKVPTLVDFIDTLPRNASGKICKHAL